MTALDQLAPHDPSLARARATLDRLRALDAALRRPEGVDLMQIAETLGVDRRTITRYLQTLRAACGPTENEKRNWVYYTRYAGRPKPLE